MNPYVSPWAQDFIDDEAIDADFTNDAAPPGVARVARGLERWFRWSEAIIAWGWALGWGILFVPCALVAIVAVVYGPRDFAWLPVVASVLLGIPFFGLIRKGIRIARTPLL